MLPTSIIFPWLQGLLGHSIGGMIVLTFCRQFPKALGTTVNSLTLVHTTYTNPLRTTTLPLPSPRSNAR